MRLDAYLFEKGYYDSRNKAAEAIKRGLVTVNGKVVTKASHDVGDGFSIQTSGREYVSVGAYKLEKALDVFSLDVSGKVFADIGASTGGFTQVLLNAGAKKVYAVDVGKDLLDKSLASRADVVKMDGVNARYLKKEDFPDELDGAFVDCSFISLKLLLPTIAQIIKVDGYIVALIKPQFECGQKLLPKSGVLLDKKSHLAVLKDLYDFSLSQGFSVKNFTFSPLNDKKNIEYVICLERGVSGLSIEDIIKTAAYAVQAKKK